MRQTKNIVNFFTSGFFYAMEPGKEQDGASCDERWYYSVQTSNDHDVNPLQPEIKEWLDSYMPGRYRVASEGFSGPDTTWLRPIYFETRADAMIFKMEWTGQCPTNRRWEGDHA